MADDAEVGVKNAEIDANIICQHRISHTCNGYSTVIGVLAGCTAVFNMILAVGLNSFSVFFSALKTRECFCHA